MHRLPVIVALVLSLLAGTIFAIVFVGLDDPAAIPPPGLIE